jgi:hypothetical protein
MTQADKKAAGLAGHVECYLLRNSQQHCSMTDATEAIWGTSGRGNPNAVRLIEAVAALGYLNIQKVGKVRRIVSRTAKLLSEEAFPAEDRKFAMHYY